MVYLAITSNGLAEVLRVREDEKTAVWCGSDAISEDDYDDLKAGNVSRFSYPLRGQESDVLAGALETIEEHHPNETVWVEQCR
ncbi:UNVERIFIED_ORG: hypothetical protein LHJ69_11270 [Shinella sp. XGS7]|nr:hypothetical protein [Shinella sp. XGS7]